MIMKDGLIDLFGPTVQEILNFGFNEILNWFLISSKAAFSHYFQCNEIFHCDLNHIFASETSTIYFSQSNFPFSI